MIRRPLSRTICLSFALPLAAGVLAPAAGQNVRLAPRVERRGARAVDV